MKFPRNARIFRGQLDVTPFAGVFFCLLIFVLLGTLVYTPGVRISLPEATPTLGVTGVAFAVGVYPNGQYYLENQSISEADLVRRLKEEVKKQKNLTLMVEADKAVTQEQIYHLRDIAISAGVKSMAQEVSPRMFDAPDKSP